MAAVGFLYGQAFLALFNKEIDFAADTIKIALCTSSYAPDQDADAYFDDISNEVAAGNGYTAGGEELTNKSIAYTAATNTVKLDGDDTPWPESTFTFRYAILYDAQTGVAATSPLLVCYDYGEDQEKTADTFSVVWPAAGIITLTTP